MGLGGYLTWTAAAREIRKVTGKNVKMFPVEQHGNFLKLIKSPSFYNNSDFFQGENEEDTFLFPLIFPYHNTLHIRAASESRSPSTKVSVCFMASNTFG